MESTFIKATTKAPDCDCTASNSPTRLLHTGYTFWQYPDITEKFRKRVAKQNKLTIFLMASNVIKIVL
jgi:hypothetical protein